MMKMRIAVIPALTLALISCSGGGGGGSSSYTTPTDPNPTGSANTITATELLAFSPATITVSKGTAVTFTFQSVTHSVLFDAGAGVANVDPSYNTSVQRTFSTAGTFAFHCGIHTYMTGQVVVQ